MVASGWRIYNASPLFGFRLSPNEPSPLGGWLAGALQWHFAAMWLLVLNGIVYLTYGIVSGHIRRKLFCSPLARYCAMRSPRCAAGSRTTISPYTTRCRGGSSRVIIFRHPRRAVGAGDLEAGAVAVLTALFGGYEGARYVHFFCMAGIVAFMVVHVALALLVPKSLRAMIIGR